MNVSYVIFPGNSYSNVVASTSFAAEQDDTCYYNCGDETRKPDTALSVDELPDIVLQPNFRQELDKQFNVSRSIKRLHFVCAYVKIKLLILFARETQHFFFNCKYWTSVYIYDCYNVWKSTIYIFFSKVIAARFDATSHRGVGTFQQASQQIHVSLKWGLSNNFNNVLGEA